MGGRGVHHAVVSRTRGKTTTRSHINRPSWSGALGCHCWLDQQWAPDTRFALLDQPAVAPCDALEQYAPDARPGWPVYIVGPSRETVRRQGERRRQSLTSCQIACGNTP